MGLSKFISVIVTSITKTTFKFNKTLDVLISQFKDSCPTSPELLNLIKQKNYINGALVAIEKKIENLNSVAQTSETLVGAMSVATTFIKQLPIPTSFPPGVGIPLSIINTFSDSLDNLGDIIKKEEGSLNAVPEALEAISKDVGVVISKLKEFGVALDVCLQQALNNNDPLITQTVINSINATTGNIVGILSNEALEKMLLEPPGLLYGDYYLRLNFITTNNFSFDKKQIIAQNKESVLEGDYYQPGVIVEELLGDESFSSSNIVLVDEMKWLIDTKNLYFPPPPPAEDPLKALYRDSQLTILMAIYQANREEAEELYDRAWDISQNPEHPSYNTLVEKAFDNSRTLLEQAVANEGYEFEDGDRVLNATLKRRFFADLVGTADETKIPGLISQLKQKAKSYETLALDEGGDYNYTSKTFNYDLENSTFSKLYLFSLRLSSTSPNNYMFQNIDSEFIPIEKEIKARKLRWQVVYESAKEMKLIPTLNPLITFNDPLNSYFASNDIGYDTLVINGFSISGNPSEGTEITFSEIESLFDYELSEITPNYYFDNASPNSTPIPDATPNGLTANYDWPAYSKYQVFFTLIQTFGISWYNKNAQTISDFSFWGGLDGNQSGGGGLNYSNVNYQLIANELSDAQWYFEFGQNNLPIPTGV